MRRFQRGASPIPFVIFLLLWLVSCYYVYDMKQKYEKADKLLARKKIAKLRLGENIPDLKQKRTQLEEHIAEIKKVLGYLPGENVNVKNVTTESVSKLASDKLNGYYDSAVATADGATHIAMKGKKDAVALKINGNWIQVPLMGQAIKTDKLRNVQYRLNLQNVLSVLRVVHDRIANYQKELVDTIAQRKDDLAKLQQASSAKAEVLTASISKQQSALQLAKGEKTKVEGKFKAEIEAFRTEKSNLEKLAQEIDNKLKRTRQEGEKDIQTYRNKIQEANRQKANLRSKLGQLRGGRKQRRLYRSLGELIGSTVETDKPDGEVLYSEPGGAYINIGKPEKVTPGLKFFVFSPGAGGSWVYRGKIEVIKVKGAISQVRTLDLHDKYQPFTKGDKVFNKVYRVPAETFIKGPTRITFVGAFPRHKDRLPYIRRTMERMGVNVQKSLTHWTEVIVVDRDYEQDADYLRATRDLNTEVITMDQLREFIAY